MTSSFDLWKVVAHGDLVLVEAAEDLESAMARVAQLREQLPGDYVIVSQATGKRITFTANGGLKRN